jgi:hypothetical protein
MLRRALKHLFAVLSAAMLVAAIHAPCAQAQGKSEQVRMPPNYKTLIANHMLKAGFRKDLLDSAMISRPYAKWGGLIRDGTMPTVCVAVWTNSLVVPTKRYWEIFYTIENGEVHQLRPGLDQCPPFSPFYEVRGRKK